MKVAPRNTSTRQAKLRAPNYCDDVGAEKKGDEKVLQQERANEAIVNAGGAEAMAAINKSTTEMLTSSTRL